MDLGLFRGDIDTLAAAGWALGFLALTVTLTAGAADVLGVLVRFDRRVPTSGVGVQGGWGGWSEGLIPSVLCQRRVARLC